MQTDFIKRLRKELEKAGNSRLAPQMKAYMKSEMPYRGVQTPVRRNIFKKLSKELMFESADDWSETVLELWDGARFREERYCAISVTQLKAAKLFQELDALDLYEHLIVSGAWWDFVDDIASHNVGSLLRKYPREMKRKMLKWSTDKNMWKRRTSILCQLGFKHETDLKLLYKCIQPSLGSKEFFLQKAIGWALRQYAWTDPNEIKRYVKANKNKMAKLSVREALKNL